MKLFNLFFVPALALFTLNSMAQVREVTVEKAFVPAQGFDDNDEILVTMDGFLPNLCFETIDHQALRTEKKIELRQYAQIKNVPNCQDAGRGLPEHLNWHVAYSKTISLGKLAAGSYTLVFKNSLGTNVERNFKVEVAPVSNNVDNELYAPVTRALIPESLYETQNLQVALSGTLEQSCLALDEVKVERVDDVIVVLPKLKVDSNSPCTHKDRPLQKIVNLGAVKVGRYLLHVRSLGGQSLSHTFTVLPRDNDMNPSNNQ